MVAITTGRPITKCTGHILASSRPRQLHWTDLDCYCMNKKAIKCWSYQRGSVASEAYREWSGEAAGARLRVNFMLKLLLSQNFCNRPLMRFISFASNIGPAAAVPAGPAPVPLGLPYFKGIASVTSLKCMHQLGISFFPIQTQPKMVAMYPSCTNRTNQISF